MVQHSGVVVYTVGLFDQYDNDRNPGILKQLARVSGGEAFFPKDIADVTEVLQAASRDIRNQYTIGYVPANRKRDATYRRVSVASLVHTRHRGLCEREVATSPRHRSRQLANRQRPESDDEIETAAEPEDSRQPAYALRTGSADMVRSIAPSSSFVSAAGRGNTGSRNCLSGG